MYEIIYASAATVPFSSSDLRKLLTVARANNAKLDVSGLLLHHAGSFLQVLEGEEDVVESLFEKISRDARHGNVYVLKRGVIEARGFGEWRMGFADPGASMPEGFTEFLRTGVAGHTVGSDEAVHRVLDGFREGRYHRSTIT
jgi:hypothetical protein